MWNNTVRTAGNPLASKELAFVSCFWGSEEIETQFSKSYYFGVEETPEIMKLIGDDYDYYVHYRDGNLGRIAGFVSFVGSRLDKGSRILELGCGVGPVGSRLQELGHDVTGVDKSEKSIMMGRNILSLLGSKMVLQAGNALEKIFPDQSFDAVVACDVIEHIPEQSLFLENIFRMLRPAGRLFIGTDNKWRVNLGVWSRRMLCLVKWQNPFHWKHAWADREGGHCALVTPKELTRLAMGAGFQSECICYSGNNFPFFKSILGPKFIYFGTKKPD